MYCHNDFLAAAAIDLPEEGLSRQTVGGRFADEASHRGVSARELVGDRVGKMHQKQCIRSEHHALFPQLQYVANAGRLAEKYLVAETLRGETIRGHLNHTIVQIREIGDRDARFEYRQSLISN